MPFETLPVQTKINIIQYRLNLLAEREIRLPKKSAQLNLANVFFDMFKTIKDIVDSLGDQSFGQAFGVHLNMIKNSIDEAEREIDNLRIKTNLSPMRHGGSSWKMKHV